MRHTGLVALVLTVAILSPRDAGAIPAWARKYNMNCSGCHYPAVPRLNAKGLAFKWAGYRMPEEIGEAAELKNITDYLALRTRFGYSFTKTQRSPASQSEFTLNDVTLFAAGALGKNYGTMLELEHAVGETELVTNLLGVWGKEATHGGVRIGQMHWLVRGAVAGFDRPTGLATPIPLSSRTTSALPFQLNTDQLGAEAFYVFGGNRLSVEVLNGVNTEGKGDEGESDTKKDFVVIDQWMYDDAGSGVAAMAYYGSLVGVDTAFGGVTSHIVRLAATANKFFGPAELQGGYVYSKDQDLPVGATFSSSSMTGNGYWVYGGYTLPISLTLFGRWEFVDPDNDLDDDARSRFVFGGVLPISLPEYLRLAAEYRLDTPQQSGAPKRNGLAAEVMFNF